MRGKIGDHSLLSGQAIVQFVESELKLQKKPFGIPLSTPLNV